MYETIHFMSDMNGAGQQETNEYWENRVGLYVDEIGEKRTQIKKNFIFPIVKLRDTLKKQTDEFWFLINIWNTSFKHNYPRSRAKKNYGVL